MFDRTKSRTAIEIQRQIGTNFQLVWANVEWVDLRKPLYSALAASLFLSLIDDPIPPAYAISSQATFWRKHFDISEFGTESDYYSYGSGETSGTVVDFVAATEGLKSEGNKVKIFFNRSLLDITKNFIELTCLS